MSDSNSSAEELSQLEMPVLKCWVRKRCGSTGRDTPYPRNVLTPESIALKGYYDRRARSRSAEQLERRRFLEQSDDKMGQMMLRLRRANLRKQKAETDSEDQGLDAVHQALEVEVGGSETAPTGHAMPAVDTPDARGCCSELSPVRKSCRFFRWVGGQTRKLWTRAARRARSQEEGLFSRQSTSNQQAAAQGLRRTQSEGQIAIRTSCRALSVERIMPRTFDELEATVTSYLIEHPDFLEQFVAKKVKLRDLEWWYQWKYIKQMPKLFDGPFTASLEGETVTEFNRIKNLLVSAYPEEELVLLIAPRLNKVLRGNALKIFGIPDDKRYTLLFSGTESQTLPATTDITYFKVRPRTRINETLTSNRYMYFSEFNDPLEVSSRPYIFQAVDNKERILQHVMCVPVPGRCGRIKFIIEVWRSFVFTMQDLEIASSFMAYACMPLGFINMLKQNLYHDERTNSLLKTVKDIFEEMGSYQHVIERILKCAQNLVEADRASLFIVDHKNKELVSHVFDMKYENDQGATHKKPIRIPMSSGFAGAVASSGKSLNIPNAYADERFNRTVDDMTGYKTRGILCLPINIGNKTIAVVQLVNKRPWLAFDIKDECSFNVFSAFFGLALQHAGLYDQIVRKEQKYRVALEVLSYHNTCRESEVEEMLSLAPNESDRYWAHLLEDFYLDPSQLSEMRKCDALRFMFHTLFPTMFFEPQTLARFILTVKKNYRDVPYHNFEHGWSVAHSMYVILRQGDQHRLGFKQRLALFVASLCHDLDHRGFTNKYMSETDSPLAAMYTTSTLEHHHFNITVTILQQEDHNIFSGLSNEEYKDVLGLIKHCILATDLAAFFPNLKHLQQLYDPCNRTFTWKNMEHVHLAMAICMTAADLSASAKPFDVHEKTVRVIFAEFYAQGDKERAAGRSPITMMDRYKPYEQATSQVDFLKQICLPCYDMLKTIFPKTEKMLLTAEQNLEIWESQETKIYSSCLPKSADSGSNSLQEASELSEDSITSDDEMQTVRLVIKVEPGTSESKM